jgi:hypothetical protein
LKTLGNCKTPIKVAYITQNLPRKAD